MTESPFWASVSGWVIGHRGSPRGAPENTLESFELALSEGAEMIEFDVRRSRDGVLFVYHDLTVPTGRGPMRRPVSSLTYEQICRYVSELEPGAGLDGRLSGGTPPPRFDQVVTQMGGRIKFDVELKSAGYERDVLEVLDRHAPQGSYVITSFRPGVVAKVKELAPHVEAGLLLGAGAAGGKFGATVFRRAQVCRADFLVAHSSIAEPVLVREAERRGYPLLVYTVNRPQTLERLLADRRIAGVITDIPATAVGIRGELGA